MPKRSSRNQRGSARGGSRGGRGRGGRGRGGGHGRNRNLIATRNGFVYEPGKHSTYSDADDYEDDFPVFAQFGAVDDPNDDGFSKRRKQRKGPAVHRAPVLGDDGLEFVRQGAPSSSASRGGYAKAVSFTRAATLVQDDDTNMTDNSKTVQDGSQSNNASNDIIMSSGDDEDNVEATGSTLGFYFDSTPSKVTFDNSDTPSATVQDDSDGQTSFYVDSTPSKVLIPKERNGILEYRAAQPANVGRSSNSRKSKRRQKKKIIPGDDLYLGTDSDSDGDIEDYQNLFNSNQDDDIALMRDYMENIQLDEEDEAAMRSFANGVNANYDDLLDNEVSDGQDDVDNGGFDYVSSDESIQEIDEDAFYQSAPRTTYVDDDDDDDDDDALAEIDEETFKHSLMHAMNDVPPSLHAGMRNRIQYEDRRAKKISKKEKRLEKQAKKGKSKKEQQQLSIDLIKMDRRIQNFIMDDQLSSYQFAPMSKICRRQIHILAAAYSLKTTSYGTGAQRMPIMQKTRETRLPSDRRFIERFIAEAQATIDARSSVLRKSRTMEPEPPSRGKKKGKKSKQKSKPQDEDRPGSKPAPNSVVGAGAEPINESNIGHRMLAAMGWKHGDSLGSNNDGISAPIEVVIRKKRVGLGS